MPHCSHPQCRIADTGVCLDGHEQGCPNFLPDELAADPTPDKVTAPTSDTAPAPRRFHTGEKLTVSEASCLLNERPARVVFCAGSRGSGKTTFLARLGEMFRDGSFSRYRFAGSLTLCGFERASWLATFTSGAGRPDTPRTRRVENDTFLHLRIRHRIRRHQRSFVHRSTNRAHCRSSSPARTRHRPSGRDPVFGVFPRRSPQTK